MSERGARRFCMWLAALLLLANGLRAQDSAAEPQKPNPDPDSRGRTTAVTLNYCRASFHRIRRYQSKRVLYEEQEKILNNLNLNGIGDEEVIRLYSQVLDEIGQIEIADRESVMLQDRFRRAVYRQVGLTAFSAAAHLATGSLEGVVRTGVNSWLDYRDLNWTREFDAFKVEKNRMTAVVDKSSKFLDTFWKMSQSRNIPDRWLVRGNDLDSLEAAVQETDLEKRLRVLKRMQSFMECYPPYWYFVARTQQGMGLLKEAADTYDRVAELAHGHFRRDDMLAASLANRAIIQQHLKQPGAVESARQALQYSPSVWEANLLCAQVLEQNGHIEEAEDAILRNLDTGLEQQFSATALLGLYFRQNRQQELAGMLASEDLLRDLPVLSVVQCVHRLGPERTPPIALQSLRESLRVSIETKFGPDDVLIISTPAWQTDLAEVRLLLPGQPLESTGIGPGLLSVNSSGEMLVRFRSAVEAGNPLGRPVSLLNGAVLLIDFRSREKSLPVLQVTLGPPPAVGAAGSSPWWSVASPASVRLGTQHVVLNPQEPLPDAFTITPAEPGDNLPADLRAPSPAPINTPSQPGRVTILGIRPVPAPPTSPTATPQPASSNPTPPDPTPVPPPPNEP